MEGRRARLHFVVVCGWVIAGCGAGNAGSPPRPWTNTSAYDAVDYAHPERHLALVPSLGDRAAIERAAEEVRAGAGGRDALVAATSWFDAHVHNDLRHPYVWRPFEQVIADGYWMWCADRAVALGTLLRAVGVPTIWVKSMEVGWIRELGAGRLKDYRGHVFLEVYTQSRWQLFDPVAMTLYSHYDPHAHLLPGGRFAYDKGDDPYSMVMSMRGEIWAKQTRDYFAGFDQRFLEPGAWQGISAPSSPVALGTRVYGICHSFVCDWITDRALATGAHPGMMFGVNFKKHLSLAVGQVLVLTRLGDDSVLPADLEPAYAPLSHEEVSRRMQDAPSGKAERRLDDGTRVILVYGRDKASLRSEIGQLTF